jgi:hypothetical protein
VIGESGFASQLDTGLLGGPISLTIVTLQTGTNHVFPGVSSPPGPGQHMIDRHRAGQSPAILAFVAVTLQHIALRKGQRFGRHPHIEIETHDAGNRKHGTHASDPHIQCLDDLRPPAKDKYDCTASRANVDRLIALV